MHFILVLSYIGVELDKYNRPNFDLRRTDLFKIYPLTWEDSEILSEDFCYTYNIQKDTGLLLDLGDMDYANAEQCKVLKPRIEERLKKPITPRLKELYTVLLDYISRAIEYNTGVWIDF